MAKKDKRQHGGKKGGHKSAVNRIENRDAFQRLNFLHQAAVLMSSTPTTTAITAPTSGSTNTKSVGINNDHCAATMRNLGRFYLHTRRSVERKLVLRSHPQVKRTICKYCGGLLVPGVSASVKVSVEERRPVVKTTCSDCGTTRRIPAQLDGESPRLFVDRAAIVEQTEEHDGAHVKGAAS
ncbi:hypothetical protein PhCBS80983_g05084 [Powellomyces hirtus]|uniref:Uncharacterized protein n=1 Tax=Powellomyces hirtus TaxID=109895 RepID=A0A507DW42_9FUNG|nr:hypothetical protein PhCBS80983_g05084 [Powellomyces hirtus]